METRSGDSGLYLLIASKVQGEDGCNEETLAVLDFLVEAGLYIY